MWTIIKNITVQSCSHQYLQMTTTIVDIQKICIQRSCKKSNNKILKKPTETKNLIGLRFFFVTQYISILASSPIVRYSFIEIWVNNTNEIKYKIKYSTNDPQSFHLLFTSHKHSVSLTQSTLDDTMHTVNQ